MHHPEAPHLATMLRVVNRHISTTGTRRALQAAGDTRAADQVPLEELNRVALGEVQLMNRARAERAEVISAAQVATRPFSVEGGTLTQTLKLKRAAVREQYAGDIATLLDRLR
jgi:long-subunit acyl-CoA synthetase (AMP-forming)